MQRGKRCKILKIMKPFWLFFWVIIFCCCFKNENVHKTHFYLMKWVVLVWKAWCLPLEQVNHGLLQVAGGVAEGWAHSMGHGQENREGCS